MARIRSSVDFRDLGISVEDYIAVRNQELYVLKHPDKFTEAQVAAAEAIAKASWEVDVSYYPRRNMGVGRPAL